MKYLNKRNILMIFIMVMVLCIGIFAYDDENITFPQGTIVNGY